ncbi:rRNA adenine N-6-methyltransferase family protein [Streptomyces sp. NPDC059928]|uniref:rRNA adenine N-6-methyltransferase family protein n=1 Tax=unclassified Streptomyces TaxID=2593676 RepID=UPI00364B8335
MTTQKHLAEVLDAKGSLPPRWARTVRRVDRGLFIPDRTRDLDRFKDPKQWAETVYSDVPIVTQYDDGRDGGPGFPTSSSSKPTVMLETLDLADIQDDDTVFEIGTATGYNTAWLCEQLTDQQVTTIEYDRTLYAQARQNLHLAGYKPTRVHGDGLLGHRPRAPYRKIIATCTLRSITPELLAQTAEGGRIVAPYGESFHSYSYLTLDVADGEGTGTFTGNPNFMWARQQRGRMAAISDIFHGQEGTPGTTGLDPLSIVADADAEFYISLKVRGVWSKVGRDDEAPDEATLWLLSEDRRSWATIEYVQGSAEFATDQYGPRQLWSEVSSAYQEWLDLDRPSRDRFHLTVTPHQERVWLDSPEHTVRVQTHGTVPAKTP